MKRLLLGLSFSITFASVAAAHTLYPKDSDGLNLRAGPGTEHPVVRVLGQGEGVPVIGRELGWYKVRLREGGQAWAAGWVARVVYDDEVRWAEAMAVLSVRAAVAEDSRSVGQLGTGQRARLLEVLGNAWLVELQNGTRGWIDGLQARETDTPPEAEFDLHLAKGVALTVSSAQPLRGHEDGYDPLDRVTAGEQLQFLEAEEGWVRVVTPRDQKGWLPGEQVAVWDAEVPFAEAAYYRLQEDDWALAHLEVRQVSDPDGLRLRSGPGLDQEIIKVMPRGTAMKVLRTQGDWSQVFLADGSFGWAHRGFTTAAANRPRVREMRLRGGKHGALTLELEGDLAGAYVAPATRGLGLVIHLPDTGTPGAQLPVGAYGVKDLLVTEAGAMVRFHESPAYTVKESTPSRMVLEFRPSVESLTEEKAEDRIRFRLAFAGAVRPATGTDGDWAWLDLPGVLFRPESLPNYMELQRTATGVRLRYPSRWPFLLKREARSLSWEFLRPGLGDKLIMIDPGHGGPDPGAVAASNGLREKDVTLAVSFKLKSVLEAAGARVVLTRSRDSRVVPPDVIQVTPASEVQRADLDWRTRLANQHRVDLFLSVHANASRAADQGTETYWARGNLNAERSQVLARLAQQGLVQSLGRPDRGVKSDLFYVIKFADAPGALAEIAFLSHREEAALLASDAFQQRAAEGLARGIERYFQAR